jgi:hypothetical protein
VLLETAAELELLGGRWGGLEPVAVCGAAKGLRVSVSDDLHE